MMTHPLERMQLAFRVLVQEPDRILSRHRMFAAAAREVGPAKMVVWTSVMEALAAWAKGSA